MLFFELALEGVRNFSTVRRIRLGEGLSVYVGEGQAGKSTLVELIEHLLYPDPIEPSTDAFLSPNRGPCRASLLLDVPKAGRYRLVKDLSSGKTALSKLDAASSSFQTVSTSPPEIAQYLGGQLGLVQQDIFQEIYVLKESDFPSTSIQTTGMTSVDVLPPNPVSKGPGGLSGASLHNPARPTRSFPGHQGMDPKEDVLPDDPAQIQSQLDILRKDLDLAINVDEWQFELDGLQSRLFALEDKTKTTKQAAKQVEEIEAKLQPFRKLTELPANFEQRVRSYEKDQEKLERDLIRLDEDAKKWESLVLESSGQTIWHDKIFLSGLVLGIVALAVGVAGFVYWEWLRYFALLDLVGFGMVVVAGFRYFDGKMTLESRNARLKLAEERRSKLKREFELATTIVRKTLAETGADTPKQLIEQYNLRNRIQQELDEARRNLEQVRRQENLDAIEADKKNLQNQIADLEQKLLAAGGLMMSKNEMERRIEILENRLAKTGLPEADQINAHQPDLSYDLGLGSPPGAGLHAVEDAGVARGSVGAAIQPCERLVNKAKDLFITEWDRIRPALEKRTGQYLSALTQQAYSQIELGPRGSITCTETHNGQVFAFQQLPAAIQDLVYLALVFSLVEAACLRSAQPLLLDDPFLRISPKLHGLIGKMIMGIAQKTQVILLTGQTHWARLTKSAYRL